MKIDFFKPMICICIIVAVLVIQGCSLTDDLDAFDNSRNSFYTRDYSLEDPRFPLIEPLELCKTSIGGWEINIGVLDIDGVTPTECYGPVDRIFCNDGIVYCHVLENVKGFNSQLPDAAFPERWFSVDLNNLKMTNYKGEESFRKGIGDSIYSLLNAPDTLFEDFKKDVMSLPWIPDTVKIEDPCWLTTLARKVGRRKV